MAPVSVRTENERGTLGNRVSAWIDRRCRSASPTRAQQLAAHRRAHAQELKESRQAVGARGADAGRRVDAVDAARARRAQRDAAPARSTWSSRTCPGRRCRSTCSARGMLESYPHVPLTDGLGLGIALLSYDGKLCWGFNADYDLVPDLADFVQDIEASFRALRAIARPIALRAAEPSPPAMVPRPAVAKKKRGRATPPTASAG